MTKFDQYNQNEPSMVLAIIGSLFLHGLFVIILSKGFFFPSHIEKIVETPIMVEFVVNDVPTSTKKKLEKPLEIKEPEPLEDKPQPAPKALEQPKPAIEKTEKAEESKSIDMERIETKPVQETPQPPVEPLVEPEPEKKPELLPLKPIPEKQVQKKPEPKKEPEKPKEKDTEPEFTSVLKNLADTQPVNTTLDGPKLTQSPTIDRVTTGELNAFQKQLSRCWNILPGANNADMMAVNLTINVNQDRTVRDVQITDKARYQSDPVFRAAADSAIRAIRHPDCTPLNLPLYKYDQWKTITLNFDPKTMF